MLGNLFKKNKKKKFSANCDISNEPLEPGSGFMITTAQLISSEKFWDHLMMEPDTRSYTHAHFEKQDETALNIRKLIFEKYSKKNNPWIVSETYLNWFDIDELKAKEEAVKWWESEGTHIPEGSSTSLKDFTPEEFEQVRHYAIMEAGRSLVKV
jgi:NDP-sugar pyrophosphorylase family protein